MKEYKVLTLADKWFRSKMDAGQLESALNELAAEGWEVKAVTTAQIGGLVRNNRDELLVVLERDKPAKARPRDEQGQAVPAPRPTKGDGSPTVYRLD